MYKVELKGLTGVLKKISGILGLSLCELLMSLPHRTPGGIYRTGFWILDFAPRLLSISNHREPLHHSLHTQELPFYWPNDSIVTKCNWKPWTYSKSLYKWKILKTKVSNKIYIYIHVYIWNHNQAKIISALSAGALEYANCTFAEE